MKFKDYDYGLFLCDGKLYFKSKYRGSAYSLETGEFWFGKTIFLENILDLDIKPITEQEVLKFIESK